MHQNIYENLVSLCTKAALLTDGKIGESLGFRWSENPYVDWYNRIFTENILLTEEDIRKIITEMNKNRLPRFLLTYSKEVINVSEKELKKQGFNMFYQQTGMAINLDLFEHDIRVENINICIVEDSKMLQNWLTTVNNSFNMNEDIRLYYSLLEQQDIQFYYLRDEGKIVSTVMTYINNGVVGLHLIATIEEQRGKGFGTLITKKVLADLKNKGFRIGVLQSSDKGKEIYKRIGFSEYCYISHWQYQR